MSSSLPTNPRRISENDKIPDNWSIAHDKMREEYKVDELQTGPQLNQSFKKMEKLKTWGGRRSKRRRTRRVKRTMRKRRASRRFRKY